MSDQQEHKDSSFFEKYFSKTTSQQEKDAMRDSIAADSFEAEAMEGFESLENDAAALAAIKEVQQQVAKKTGLKQSRQIAFPVWKSLGIAAAVAVFVVAGFMVSNMLENDNAVAKNEQSEPSFKADGFNTELDEPSGDLNGLAEVETLEVVNEEIDELLQDDKLVESELALGTKQAETKDVIIEKTPTPVESPDEESFSDLAQVQTEDYEAEEIEESADLAPETVVANDLVNVEEVNAARKEVATTISVSKTATESSAPAVSNYATGKSNYDNRSYSEAINYFQQAVAGNEKVNESNYYMAMSYFNLNKNNKALKFFDQVLTSNSALRYNAMWYKAIILEEKGDINGAKSLLEQLANGTSGFKNQAADKLNSLD